MRTYIYTLYQDRNPPREVFRCEAGDILEADAQFNQAGIETDGKKLKAAASNVTCCSPEWNTPRK